MVRGQSDRLVLLYVAFYDLNVAVIAHFRRVDMAQMDYGAHSDQNSITHSFTLATPVWTQSAIDLTCSFKRP